MKLRGKAFDRQLVTASDYASLLGSSALFGAIPDSGLDALIGSPANTPLLLLRSDGTLGWTFLKEFTNADHFVRGAFRARLALANVAFYEIGGSPVLFSGWAGGDSLFPLKVPPAPEYPYLPILSRIWPSQSVPVFGWRPVEPQAAQYAVARRRADGIPSLEAERQQASWRFTGLTLPRLVSPK